MSDADFDPEYVFTHHEQTPEKVAHYDAIHAGAKHFAETILAHTPASVRPDRRSPAAARRDDDRERRHRPRRKAEIEGDAPSPVAIGSTELFDASVAAPGYREAYGQEASERGRPWRSPPSVGRMVLCIGLKGWGSFTPPRRAASRGKSSPRWSARRRTRGRSTMSISEGSRAGSRC